MYGDSGGGGGGGGWLWACGGGSDKSVFTPTLTPLADNPLTEE